MCEWKGNSHKLLYLPCLVWPFRTRFQADLKAPYEENTETAGYQTVCLQEGQTATPTLPFLCRQSLSVFYFALNIYQNLTLTPSPYLQVWALRPLPSYSKFWSLWVNIAQSCLSTELPILMLWKCLDSMGYWKPQINNRPQGPGPCAIICLQAVPQLIFKVRFHQGRQLCRLWISSAGIEAGKKHVYLN